MTEREPIALTVTVCLTSTPTRIAHLDTTLASLRAQSRPADSIHLNVPAALQSRIPSSIVEEDHAGHAAPVVQAIRGPDPGPIAKILPSLQTVTDPSALLVTVDDDVAYPPDLLEKLMEAAITHPDMAFGGRGFYFEPGGSHLIPVRGHGQPCQVLQGYGGCAYRRSFFDLAALTKFLADMPRDHAWSDDLILSNHLAERGVARRTVEFQDRLVHLVWGDDDPNALKYRGDGTHRRYRRMRDDLVARGAWFVEDALPSG